MHKNTFLVVAFLAVFAALIIGVNIGKRLNPNQTLPVPAPSPTVPAPSPAVLQLYKNPVCGLTFSYPDTLTKTEDASGSAAFSDSSTGQQIAVVTCQNEIPRPALLPTKIETLRITNDLATSSVSAKLYHDSSAKDGTPVDVVIWRTPDTTFDVYIAGYGTIFNQILQTIRLLP